MPVSFDLKDKNHVLIYHMGKIGSNALRASLERIGAPYNYAQILREERLAQLIRLVPADNRDVHEMIRHQVAVRNAVADAGPDAGFKVITAVREPVGYFVSCIFQSLNLQSGEDAFRESHGDLTPDNVARYIRRFFDGFFEDGRN